MSYGIFLKCETVTILFNNCLKNWVQLFTYYARKNFIYKFHLLIQILSFARHNFLSFSYLVMKISLKFYRNFYFYFFLMENKIIYSIIHLWMLLFLFLLHSLFCLIMRFMSIQWKKKNFQLFYTSILGNNFNDSIAIYARCSSRLLFIAIILLLILLLWTSFYLFYILILLLL